MSLAVSFANSSQILQVIGTIAEPQILDVCVIRCRSTHASQAERYQTSDKSNKAGIIINRVISESYHHTFR